MPYIGTKMLFLPLICILRVKKDYMVVHPFYGKHLGQASKLHGIIMTWLFTPSVGKIFGRPAM